METMKSPPNKPGINSDEIALYEVRFRMPHPDLGQGIGSPGGSGVLRAKKDLKIAFLPKQQLIRFTAMFDDVNVKQRTVYVPRDWASMEFLEV